LNFDLPQDLPDWEQSFGARLTIDVDALAENWRTLSALSGRARCAAVVKADGYGLGYAEVAKTLYASGCRDFFVATAPEGARVRSVAPDARIFVMNCILPGIEKLCFGYDLVPVLASMEHVAAWAHICAERGDHPCALQVDTGMNRLGVTCDEALALAADIARPAGFSPVLVMSHLACSDDPDNPMNRRQLEAFRRVAAAYPEVEMSLAASAGIILGPDYHFDLTRPGIAIYGGRASSDRRTPLGTVVTAEAQIMTIREARAGDAVSYGATAQLERDSRIAVCSVGYADGYLRSLSGSGIPLRSAIKSGGYAWCAGFRVPVLGRVTMDITAFDVTDVPRSTVRPGDFIELFGDNVLLDEVAECAGTIGYELLTSLGYRYHRRYVRGQAGQDADG